MRNQNISTEILGDFKCLNQESDGNVEQKGPPYAVATLDGTIMLVQDEVILWYLIYNDKCVLYIGVRP